MLGVGGLSTTNLQAASLVLKKPWNKNQKLQLHKTHPNVVTIFLQSDAAATIYFAVRFVQLLFILLFVLCSYYLFRSSFCAATI